jgi:hypothetical protein
MLRLLVWAQSKDGQKGRNRPKMVEGPKQRAKSGAGKQEEGMTAEQYQAKLARERTK